MSSFLAPFTLLVALLAPAQPRVLIIGIDGCRPDALRKAHTPNLDGLLRQGAFSYQAQTGDRTISGPGWSSLLTGVWRSKHGVRDNDFEGADFRAYPHLFRRLKQQRPRAFTASVVHWAPLNTAILADADLAITVPEDRLVAAKAEQVLRDRDPDALFVHFDEVDGAGHRHGFHPDVGPYVRAIEQTDRYVGRLLQAVRGRKTYAREDWLVLVSTDHGGSGKGHGRDLPEHRTIFLIVSGPSAARGEIKPAPGIVDVAATALEHLGVAIDPRWGLDGRPVGLRGANRSQEPAR
jgi:predicted AlkP superfamily pyrophosphatase or phosphodiesterase